ncbi:MAG: laccase domain-containing protein [Actinobacteria bacterium]|nr:laccase domain-containing protein [Actinomycetota bacterium]
MTGPPVIEAGTDATGAPVRMAFSTREGGHSAGAFASLNLGATTGDDPGAVRANRQSLARSLGVDAARAASMTQVHGARVVEIGAHGGEERFAGTLDGVAECDALVTRVPGVALVAMGADCPVIGLWDERGQVVAAVHAGWRGIVAGVIPAAVAAMGADPTTVTAAVGPHVGPCCYPVDDDLRSTMAARHGPDVAVGDAVDLGLACRRALEGAGVPRGRIKVDASCTACDAQRFFSYRRDGGATGRQGAVVWIEDRA